MIKGDKMSKIVKKYVDYEGLSYFWSGIKNKLSAYATKEWTTEQGYLTDHQSLSGYATEEWVEEQGFLTSHQDLSDYALASSVPTKTSDLQNDSGFLTAHQDLSGYATEQWVNQQGFLKEGQGGEAIVQVTPDWNENDPEASGYISNRTHYSEIGLNRPSSGTYPMDGFFGLIDYTDYIKPENLPIPVTTVDYSIDANTQEVVLSEPVLTGESLTKTFDYNGQPAYASDGVTFENDTLSGNGYMSIYSPQSMFGGGTILYSVENGTPSGFVQTDETTGYVFGISMPDYETVHKLDKKFVPYEEFKADLVPNFTDYGNGNESVGPGYGGNYKIGVWVEAALGDTNNGHIVGFSGVSGQTDSNGLSIDGYSDMVASKLSKLLQLGDTVSYYVMHDILTKSPKLKVSYSYTSGGNTYTADNQEVEKYTSTKGDYDLIKANYQQSGVAARIDINAVSYNISGGKLPLSCIIWHYAGYSGTSVNNDVTLLQLYFEVGTGYSDPLDYSAVVLNS